MLAFLPNKIQMKLNQAIHKSAYTALVALTKNMGGLGIWLSGGEMPLGTAYCILQWLLKSCLLCFSFNFLLIRTLGGSR